MNSVKTNKKKRDQILKRIALKGGLMGMVAVYCIADNQQFDGNQFLIECFEQCHTNSVQEFWGLELVNDVIDYNIKYNGKTKLDLVRERLF